jgi:hypothetical protein
MMAVLPEPGLPDTTTPLQIGPVYTAKNPVPDPDPNPDPLDSHVFGPPGTGSRSFYNPSIIKQNSKKNLTVL